MKTAIYLLAQVFAQSERLARRLRKSRSQLYREAVSEFITRHDPDPVTEAMDQAVEQVEATLDEFSRAAAHRVLVRTEW